MVPGSCHIKCRQAVATLLLLMCSVSHYAQARSVPQQLISADDEKDQKRTPELRVVELDGEMDNSEATSITRTLKFLEPTPALVLPYHNGPLLSSASGIPVYLIWYGTFSSAQKSIVTDFFASFSSPGGHPTVSSWWGLTSGYKDSADGAVSSAVVLGGQTSVSYTLGTALTEADVQTLVVDSLTTFPSTSNGVYLVLTASDVMVSDFCMSSCGSHFSTLPGGATGGQQLPYGWVGNPSGSTECQGLCAWPYAGSAPLVSPNGDVGMDGMMINIGVILAGTATDPFLSGFYQGDASNPLEAASACAGIFGAGAYAGYPGDLLVDSGTGASYNVDGANGRKYLMPSLWDPNSLACAAPA